MTVVIWDQAAFLERYPEFQDTIAKFPRAGMECFEEAGLFLNNTDSSIVPAPTPRARLLGMLTAHIMALNFGVNGQAPSGVVGRVTSATEGSVSVTADMGPSSSNKAWFEQTQYGASYYRAVAPYRTARYVPPVICNTRNFY